MKNVQVEIFRSYTVDFLQAKNKPDDWPVNEKERERMMRMDIYVSINTNHGFGETKIEDGAIHEFTTKGFAEGTYDARVEFSCLPAAVDRNALSVIIEFAKDIADYGEMILFYAGICKAVFKFLSKCHGYYKTIEIDGAGVADNIIEVPNDLTEEELEAKVFAILESERKKTSKTIMEIMETEEII